MTFFPGGKWKAYVDTTHGWMNETVSIGLICDLPDGSYVTPINWGSEETSGAMVMYQVTAADRGKINDKNVPLVLHEDAAKSLMEALQKHFGAYAGVDYERLRSDYDRVTQEANISNGFIRDTLKTILEGRKPKTDKE